MGSSKTYRGAPGWEPKNTPRGENKVSKGAIVNAEGTHQSGSNDYGRKGLRSGARMKSRSGMKSAKSGTYGQS